MAFIPVFKSLLPSPPPLTRYLLCVNNSIYFVTKDKYGYILRYKVEEEKEGLGLFLSHILSTNNTYFYEGEVSKRWVVGNITYPTIFRSPQGHYFYHLGGGSRHPIRLTMKRITKEEFAIIVLF